MDRMQYNELNVVKTEIPYSKIVDMIEFVVSNSYSKEDGRYHEYLTDYSEAVVIMTMYTDCQDYDFKFDDVMNFIQTDKWDKIKEELGDAYINFHYYVKKEIEYHNTPLRFADNALKSVSNSLSKINDILGAIDVDALKGYDFSKIINAIDAVDTAHGEEDSVKNNVVDISEKLQKQ